MVYHILNYQDDRPVSYNMDSGPDWKADSGPGWQHFGPPDGFGSPIREAIEIVLLGPKEGNGPMLH